MPICLYCNCEKDDTEFSQEHVIPRGVGGAITPVNPFVINNTCKQCNSVAGFFIDAPFLKSWIIKNHRAENARKFINISNTSILPLNYFGEIDDLKIGNKLCEYWLGPTGDGIYHFHEPYPVDSDTSPIVGVPPGVNIEEIDNGFVFIFVRSENPDWHPTIFNSVIDNFKNVDFYLGNGPTPPGGIFSDIPDSLKSMHDKLIAIQGREHEVKPSIDIYLGDRFLGKFALGIGSILLNESFGQSESAGLLRRLMWTKKTEDRKRLPIYGAGFIRNSGNELNNILNWENGHVIAITINENGLSLYVNFYEKNSAVILITNEEEHWKNKIDKSICYVIVPGLQAAVGPIEMEEFIAHKINVSYENQELKELEERMSEYNDLPPFDV